MKEFKAVIVDDDPDYRGLLLECLRFTVFDAEGYDEAERLLMALDLTDPLDMPDLIIVDLQLQPLKMQGLELITRLAERDIPSEVVAMSGAYPTADLAEAIKIGASAMMPKMFGDILQLIIKMKHLAEIGKKRRLKLKGLDPDRQVRPVFLSYCAADTNLATGLKRNIEAHDIGVWYSPSSASVGDQWRPRLEAEIDQALVFVALITDNYLASAFCYGELVRFRSRAEFAPEPSPLLLPVVAGLSAAGWKHPLFRPIQEQYQCMDLFVRFIDRLSTLLGRIEFHILKASKAQLNVAGHKGAQLDGRGRGDGDLVPVGEFDHLRGIEH